jgi:sugar transferase (PEP-CTERM system associated)
MLRVFKQYYPIRNVFFVVGEGLSIFLSVSLATLLILGKYSFVYEQYLLLKILLITVVCQASLYYNDLYEFKISENYKELGIRLVQALGSAAIFLAFVYLIIPPAVIGTGIFIISVGFVVLLIVSWRFCYTMVLNRGYFNQKIILLGSADLTTKIKLEINERKDCGYHIVAEIPEASHSGKTDNVIVKNNPGNLCGQKYEGLAELARVNAIEKIVVALEEKRNNFPLNELLNCRVNGIEVIDGNSFYEMLTGKLVVKAINPSWLIFSKGFSKSRTRRLLKRSVDILLSLILMVLFLPLILIISLLLKIDSKGPVIFSQERVGQNRKIYRMHKFRSMVHDAETVCGPVWAEDDDPRITRVGRIIRKWRFDEVPQLWNVLKGDMSFIGPRPEREHFVDQLEKMIPYYSERHTVKPGISGWAQVSYGYGASVEDAIEKLNYDLFYIKNMTFFMDLMIVLRTIKIVLFRKGAR